MKVVSYPSYSIGKWRYVPFCIWCKYKHKVSIGCNVINCCKKGNGGKCVFDVTLTLYSVSSKEQFYSELIDLHPKKRKLIPIQYRGEIKK